MTEIREAVATIIEEAVAVYIEQGYRTYLAGIGEYGDEPAQRKAAEQLRHLHYAEPWLPAIEATNAIELMLEAAALTH